MTKDERRARHVEKQRAITAADQAARGYVPETPRKRAMRKARNLKACANYSYDANRVDGFDRDDLGESFD